MSECPEYAWIVSTGPVIEPFTLAEAKAQIRSVQNQEDAVVLGYIKAARSAAEDYLGRALLTQTITLTLSDFTTIIPLPQAAPLQSVTSVKYYDVNGVQQTLSTNVYTVDTVTRPGRIALAANQSWPAVESLRRVRRIEIVYVVGYTSRELIPDAIRQGMRLYLGYLDTDRDGLEPGAKQALDVAKSFWTDRVFYTPPQYD